MFLKAQSRLGCHCQSNHHISIRFGKKPPPSGFRVRRDIRVLNITERQKVFRAFDDLYKTGVMARFGRVHGSEIYRKHSGAGFLPWHRVFTTALEEKLREVDPEVSLPYWDYSMDYYMPLPNDSIVWSKCFFGNGNNTVSDGPFRFMYGGFNMPIKRDIMPEETCPPGLISKADIDGLMEFCHFANITTGRQRYNQNRSHNLESLHNSVHNWVGGDMADLGAAAYDPIFFMHHAFIDYIWEQFRRRQSSNECNVDAEKDYREPGDYSIKNDTIALQRPTDAMQAFNHLQIRDGLWNNWTTSVYGYEPAPKCPECGNSENLYCNMTIDPRRPEGVCVPKSIDFCVDPPLYAFHRDETYNKPQGDGAKLSLGPRHLGVPGDGRTRFMSQEDGLVSLRNQLAIDMPTTSQQVFSDNRISTSIPVLATLSSVLGILVVTLGIHNRKITKQLQSLRNPSWAKFTTASQEDTPGTDEARNMGDDSEQLELGTGI
ncbi:putative tyrosinase-like protein tyr-3 [Dreissena polymorpha]|uniref:putative tyrosinase-like protein tyr-3 n=1 Tax=Dreissena polymorpha TaxID=45954 RepID=UPI002264F4CA|nr:putative tyrosinase-like protein tyr-3 [Dreissena polymorpha]